MTNETEIVKLQIQATKRAKILLEQNDYLIVKWMIPRDDGNVRIKFSFEAYAYSATGMGNNFPWSCEITEEQAEYFLEHIGEATEFFKSKHHYFHTEVTEVSYADIHSIGNNVIRFRDGRTVSYRECVSNFSRLHPGSEVKCVGECDITANPPYIELYSVYSHYRILFDRKGLFSKKENLDNFRKLQKQIQDYGYSTFDLS